MTPKAFLTFSLFAAALSGYFIIDKIFINPSLEVNPFPDLRTAKFFSENKNSLFESDGKFFEPLEKRNSFVSSLTSESEIKNTEEKAATSSYSDNFSIPISAPEKKSFTTIFNNAENDYKDFSETLAKTSFTADEFKALKKNDSGMALLLEELIELAHSGTPLADLKPSFDAWKNLDQRLLNSLVKFRGSSVSFYGELVNWYGYHLEIAKRLANAELSASEVERINSEFMLKARVHNLKFKQALAGPIKARELLDKIISLISLIIPKAEAVTCGAVVPPPLYHFGGLITVLAPCDFGVVIKVIPPCGGLFFLSYPVLSANPFNWHLPVVKHYILGRSTLTPGVCPVDMAYGAIGLYFGTSLTPF